MNRLETFSQKNNFLNVNFIAEDKILKFGEYVPTKYNGNTVVSSMMEWLRVYIDGELNDIRVNFDKFLKETNINKDKFLTFVNDKDNTKKANNISIKFDGDDIIFHDMKRFSE